MDQIIAIVFNCGKKFAQGGSNQWIYGYPSLFEIEVTAHSTYSCNDDDGYI